jgi:hypothetical protein
MTQAVASGLSAGIRRLRSLILVFASSLAVLGCGGGGGSDAGPPSTPDTPLIYGTAAEGAAIEGTIIVKDSAGRVVSVPVSGSSGEFSISVKDMKAPFMLKAVNKSGKTVLYSAAAAAGRANISPLTQLGMMRLAAQAKLAGPGDLYASPSSFEERLTGDALRSASSVAMGRLMPAFVAGLPGAKPDSAPVYDPFATPYAVGDKVDRLLDAYPIHFSQNTDGVLIATQTNVAANVVAVVLRTDTAGVNGEALSITSATTQVLPGSAVQLSALATFSNGATQTVPVTWKVSDRALGEIDANGRFIAASLTVDDIVVVTAQWFDGTQTLTAQAQLIIMPTSKPVAILIDTVGLVGNSLNAGEAIQLVANVSWADGRITSPSVTWSWIGDESAVRELDANGYLVAGDPAFDQAIDVKASFTYQGTTVEASVPFIITQSVPTVVAAEITGFTAGTRLLAGEVAQLTVLAHWTDGSQSIVPATWEVTQTNGVQGRTSVDVSADGQLTSTLIFVSPNASADERADDSFVALATVADAYGGTATATTEFSVRPLVNEPVSLSIYGATELMETAVTSYQAFVTYADGSSEEVSANWSSLNTALLQAMNGGAFQALPYTEKPTQADTARIAATQTYSYLDDSGNPVAKTLSAELDVAITWVEPTLQSISMPSDLDFLEPGPAGVGVHVTGQYRKFGRHFEQEVADVSLSSSNAWILIDGTEIRAEVPPAAASNSWAMIRATAFDPTTNSEFSAQRIVTIDRPVAVPKRLLAYPWGPRGASTQFRALSSDGRLLDYNVVRDDIYRSGFYSAATVNRVPFLSGLSDFAQSQAVGDETQYVAAVSEGELVLMRLDDLYDPARAVQPIVPTLPGMATAAALVYRAGASGQTESSLVYVRMGDGTVHRYALPARLERALKSSDVVHEKQLAGVYDTLSAGAEHILMSTASGTVFAEGSNAHGQIGDPTDGAIGWHELFQVQAAEYDYGATPFQAAYSDFSGATAIWAERNSSLATDAANLRGWGEIDSVYYLKSGESDTGAQQVSAATRLFTAMGPARAMTAGAFVQADGSVIYREADFSGSSFNNVDLGGGGQRVYQLASWLPPARQIVACRRQITNEWPFNGGLVKLMPIVRTETDTLLYLDGRPIKDTLGNAVFIP